MRVAAIKCRDDITAEYVPFLGGIIGKADTCHHFASFLDEGLIETENASCAVMEAFSKPDSVEPAEIPSMPGDESVQRVLMTAILEVPGDILDVLFTLFTEQQAGEIGVKMVPLRF